MDAELEQFLAVVDSLPDPVFILSESGRYVDIVGGSDSRLYHDGSVLVGKTLFEVLPEEKVNWFLDQIKHALNNNCLQTVEYALGGEEVEGLDTAHGPTGMLWFEGRIQPLQSTYAGERAVVWVARNITERYKLESQLRRLSEHDELTGVYNRRKFIEELENHFGEFQRYHTATTLLMLDVDYFKAINDQLGHLGGDTVLKEVANICQRLLRKVDILARFGGEEFVFLLPHSVLKDGYTTAQRISHEISHMDVPFDLKVTVSIGGSEILATDKTPNDVIRRADRALYRAKHEGRNRVVCSNE